MTGMYCPKQSHGILIAVLLGILFLLAASSAVSAGCPCEETDYSSPTSNPCPCEEDTIPLYCSCPFLSNKTQPPVYCSCPFNSNKTEYPFCCGCPFGASCDTTSGLKTDYFKADFSADLKSGNAPLTVQFEDWSFGEPDSWSWNFGDGGSSTQQNPIHTYRNPGTYTVILTVSREFRTGFTEVTESRTIAKNAFITVTGVSSAISPAVSQSAIPVDAVTAGLGDRIQERERDIRNLVGSPTTLSSMNFPEMTGSEDTRVNVIKPMNGNTIGYPVISIEERTAGITEVLSQSRITLTQGGISETGWRSFIR